MITTQKKYDQAQEDLQYFELMLKTLNKHPAENKLYNTIMRGHHKVWIRRLQNRIAEYEQNKREDIENIKEKRNKLLEQLNEYDEFLAEHEGKEEDNYREV